MAKLPKAKRKRQWIPDSLMTDTSGLQQAQTMVYQAWEAATMKTRIARAKKALALSPLCADAWLILGDAETDPVIAKAHFEKALAVAEQVLGPDAFVEFHGGFWGFLETRPYMRARAALAQALWEEGNSTEARRHWEGMLELNPGDNQGVRELLLEACLRDGDLGRAERLFKSYPDDGQTAMAYGLVLVHAQSGRVKQANKAMSEACRINPHVPRYLLDARKPEPQSSLPGYVTWGGEDEAWNYANRFRDIWMGHPASRELLNKAPIHPK